MDVVDCMKGCQPVTSTLAVKFKHLEPVQILNHAALPILGPQVGMRTIKWSMPPVSTFTY